jgi:hypothetical protein
MPDTSDSERPLHIDKQIKCPSCNVFPIHGSLGAIYNCLITNLLRERSVSSRLAKIITIREATIHELITENERLLLTDSGITRENTDNGKKE